MPGIRPYVGPMLCPARPWRPNPRLLVIGTLLGAVFMWLALKAIARGERDMATTLADLPHDLAREEMERCVAHEIPIQQARAALAQRKAGEKAAERLAKAQERLESLTNS